MTKGFKFTKFIKPTVMRRTQFYTIHADDKKWIELRLSTAVKLNSMNKLKTILKGRIPDRIIITRKQYEQYQELFPEWIFPPNNKNIAASYNGIPMFVNL